MFPLEGAVLDLWTLHEVRLPSRHSKGARCDKSLQGRWLGSRHQNSAAHGGAVSIGQLRGMNITVTDVFQSAAPQTRIAPVNVASDNGMISFQAEMLAFKLSQSKLFRLANARTGPKINCMSTAFGECAQQGEAAWLQSVTRAAATVEVLCHADL